MTGFPIGIPSTGRTPAKHEAIETSTISVRGEGYDLAISRPAGIVLTEVAGLHLSPEATFSELVSEEVADTVVAMDGSSTLFAFCLMDAKRIQVITTKNARAVGAWEKQMETADHLEFLVPKVFTEIRGGGSPWHEESGRR